MLKYEFVIDTVDRLHLKIIKPYLHSEINYILVENLVSVNF